MRGHNAIRKHTNREKAWKVMRGMRSFTAADIASVAEVPDENIKHWMRCLVHAGYLRVTGKKRQEGRPGTENVYLLLKNTGPKPPVQKELRFLFDQNTNTYWCEADPDNALRGEAMLGCAKRGPARQGDPKQGSGVRPAQKSDKVKLGCGLHLLCPRAKREVKNVD